MDTSRRDAILHLAVMLGATAIIPRLSAATFDPTQTGAFTQADIALLDDIGDTIIPASDVPGARAVGIGAFLAMMMTDCYTASEQAVLREGLQSLTAGFAARFGHGFSTGTSDERTSYLNDLDREQRAYQATLSPGAQPHYFRVLKELTILGYFSSEVGATQALRYAEVPGAFDGNAPYRPGDRAWFN